ncbi:transcription regulator PAB1642 [Poronia punctata]|nr:transcription regulator PAB1642 [Poronia punctata]
MSSFTQALVASDPAVFQRATQSPFLRRAAQGTVSKEVLGRYLANDRLYVHGYLRAAGRLISFLPLPQVVPAAGGELHADPASRLLAWTIDDLINIQHEERFLVDTARKYGIEVNLPADEHGRVPASAKTPGLRQFEALFDGLQLGGGDGGLLPWLESAVVFYGTEKCYLEAWTWAKSQVDEDKDKDGADDEDGGMVRRELIANWTGPEFEAFVDQLAGIIDAAVQTQEEDAKEALLQRGLVKWREILAAEEASWPVIDADPTIPSRVKE